MEAFPQINTTDRQLYAAGRFYSSDKETLLNDLSSLFNECKKGQEKKNVRAIISPHAGYVFSGRVAASAFSAIPENHSYKNIFIIGSSHIMSFQGASIYNTGDYMTPLGRATVNLELANTIIKGNEVFNFPVNAHISEHSIEVQVPFIQYYFKNNPPIIPIIIGTNNEKIIRIIAEALKPWFTPDNLFIFSSDFSHYPSYDKAVEVDKHTVDALTSGDPEIH
jgi:AmmeMemoRadiSam system protein B